MEPWEKIYIRLRTGQTIPDIDPHLQIACVDCHGGNASQPNNKEAAHTGLIADPSEYRIIDGQRTNSCAGANCHESLVKDQYGKSLHQNLWGEKVMVAARSGVQSFDQCPQTTIEGYNGECASCHATCGDCHIAIPNSAGSGFPKTGPIYSSHKFYKTPDMQNNCTACHGSRVAHDFYGEEGVRPGDVHYENNMTCLECHTQAEMHGAIAETDQNSISRYHYDQLPACQDCHSGITDANLFHSYHIDDMTCYVCHSQTTYNNCTACHVDNVWQTDPVYQNNNPVEDFRIGLNPLYSTFEQGDLRKVKFATLRHIPIAPDSYANWGAASASLPGYNTVPTWKYTSPHNIRRYNDLTEGVSLPDCYSKCHISANSANKNYYLFKSYVDSFWSNESDANTPVFVDGHLPDGWE
ncbi:MAG: hypothetical protein JXR46_16580 [Calditrichaceae bacterium]|nr:hypothetical protein [Calditrichaceae bacterium]RQV96673.1 MAG: hypothetical protein EH224_03735 [Calditrichota bacterium]